MKITKKIISVLLAFVMTLGMMIPAFALLPDASASEGDVEEIVIVPVEFKDVLSLDGKYVVEDPNGIIENLDVTSRRAWCVCSWVS